MTIKKIGSAFIISVLTVCQVYAQRDTLNLNTIISRSIKFSNTYPVEKVYIHFDKPYYAAGDTVWLKAYATIDLHQPTALSKIVYVDVFNDQDSLVSSLKLPLTNGVAPGMLPLPRATYKQGNYRLRAYTLWMLNFDANYLFSKVLVVGNTVDKEVLTNVSYTLSSGPQPSVTARVRYLDASNQPYINKKISWQLESGHDVTVKGHGVTDAGGYAVVGLPPTPSLTLASSALVTTIETGAKSISSTFPLKSAAPGRDVQFFPEGGQLIAGLPMKIAVKAIKADGLGIDFKGTINDNQGQAITTFSSLHLGMGQFVLVAEAGKSYKATITFADGVQNTYDLPRVQASGITLVVSRNAPDTLTLRIMAAESYFNSNQNKNLSIVAQQGGFIKYAAQAKLQQQIYTAVIPKSKFQSGILQITLFGANGYPVAERLAFIARSDLMTLNIATDKTVYSRRQPVRMTVTAKNGLAPAEGNLSVAVIDESKVQNDEAAESTILSNLLLTSDLRGYIEKPNYYFDHPDEKTAANLDILMLTQGYRRFVYRDVLAEKYPKLSVLPEEGMTVTGTLRNRTGLPIFKGFVRLLIPEKNFAAQAITNADGQFKFQNLVFNDSSKVVINARDNVNPNSLMVMVDGSPSPAPTRITNLPDERLNIDSAMRPYLENSKRVYAGLNILKEVVVKSSTPKRLGHLDQAALAGLSLDPDHFVDGARFKGCTFFPTCLQAMAPGLTYVDNVIYVTRDYNQGIRKPMEVYLDGLQVDMTILQQFNANDIESVEVFFKDGISGINQRGGTDGVLVINKKKVPKSNLKLADLQNMLPPPYLVSMTPRGYDITKEFYSPKYEPGKAVAGKPDLRSTIYWNPKVTTDKLTGAANLQFNNGDGTGSYRAVIEGIDKDGHIGRFVYRYKVQ